RATSIHVSLRSPSRTLRLLRVFVLFAAFGVALSPATLFAQDRFIVERAATAPGSPRASAVRNGFLPTEPGLRFKLTTDLGSVRIVTLSPGEAPVVRYSVEIETDAAGRAAEQLLAQYSLAAKAFPGGVQITGALPPQAARTRGTLAQFW